MGYYVDDGVATSWVNVVRFIGGSPEPGVYRCLLFDRRKLSFGGVGLRFGLLVFLLRAWMGTWFRLVVQSFDIYSWLRRLSLFSL